MPGLAIPDTTLLTAASNDMTDYMAALNAHFTNTSTRFSIKANGPTNDAFTLVPNAAGENWELNFRRTSTLVAQMSIDPLEGITDPGNTTTPPTLADASEWSGEVDALKIDGGGAEDVDFYVNELDDALFVLFVNAANTFTPRGLHAGRVYIPYFDDGISGDKFADGLGVLGSIPRASFGGTEHWLSDDPDDKLLRVAQTLWAYARVETGALGGLGRINSIERIRPLQIDVFADGAFSENRIGFTKYFCRRRTSESPGTLLDAGAGKDAWVSIFDSDTIGQYIIPWDRNVTPIF